MVEAMKADKTRQLCRKGAGETEGLCPETVLIKESFCPEDTWEMGRVLGSQAGPGQIYCLDGDCENLFLACLLYPPVPYVHIRIPEIVIILQHTKA
ncbi:MAG: hypothetical protein HFG63_06950, partial [Lachnospiraceae bacterium]|nr:hypothetical protein [Lachnospiraceae bacterium]